MLTHSPKWWDGWKVALFWARARMINSEALCLLLQTNHIQGRLLGNKQERQRMHKGKLQLTLLKFQRSIADTQMPTAEKNYLKDARLQHHWALCSQRKKNYKNSSCLSLLKILVVLSGPACCRVLVLGVEVIHSAESNREIGKVDPGRKWKK